MLLPGQGRSFRPGQRVPRRSRGVTWAAITRQGISSPRRELPEPRRGRDDHAEPAAAYIPVVHAKASRTLHHLPMPSRSLRHLLSDPLTRPDSNQHPSTARTATLIQVCSRSGDLPEHDDTGFLNDLDNFDRNPRSARFFCALVDPVTGARKPRHEGWSAKPRRKPTPTLWLPKPETPTSSTTRTLRVASPCGALR